MSANGQDDATATPGDRAGAPATRGNNALVKWIGYSLFVAIGLGGAGWVLLHDSTKKPAVVEAESAKPKKYNPPALDTPAPTITKPRAATVVSVQPASLVVGSGEHVITIRGTGLEAVTSVAAPGSGLMFNGDVQALADGTTVTVRASVPATAVTGSYRLLVRTPTGEAKGASGEADRILLDSPSAAPVAPAWIPPLPAATRPPALTDKATTATPVVTTAPGAKPPIDPYSCSDWSTVFIMCCYGSAPFVGVGPPSPPAVLYLARRADDATGLRIFGF
jgi:hypothetical protein